MARNNMNAMQPVEPAVQGIAIFNDPNIGDLYSTFSPDTIEGKIKLYNAINSPDHRLADFINTPIFISDVVVSKVKLAERIDQKTPQWIPEDKERDGFRVVIIDAEGKSYTATSTGIYNSICTLRSVFGTLHFDEPLKTIVKQISTKNGNTLTLSLSE